MAKHPKLADCENCEAPCCTRQVMTDGEKPMKIADARAYYTERGTNLQVVGWQHNDDGTRQAAWKCLAFDPKTLGCTIYNNRPDHCHDYDCRGDDADNWESRAHCLLDRHRKIEAARAKARAGGAWIKGGSTA